MSYLNSQRLVPRPVPALDNLHEFTPVEDYDLNSVLPVPKGPLETALVIVQPFVVCDVELSGTYIDSCPAGTARR